MSYRSVKTANLRNKERVHECWNQHLTQLYKQKLRHFLSSQLIYKPKNLDSDAENRVAEVKSMLGREHWDDIAINRASIGFCGWMQCCSPSDPRHRSLFQLRLVMDTDMDRDVIDSFHSFKCFQDFCRIRMQLNEKPAAFRPVPKSLRSEYDLQEFGRCLSDDERKNRFKEEVGKQSGVQMVNKFLKPVTSAVSEIASQQIPFRDDLEILQEDPPRGCRTNVCSPSRSRIPHLFESLSKKRGKLQGERKDWMQFRPEHEILDELGLNRPNVCKISTDSAHIVKYPTDETDDMMILFEYQSCGVAPHAKPEKAADMATNDEGVVDSGAESGLLLSSVNSGDSMIGGESSRCQLISALKKSTSEEAEVGENRKQRKTVTWAKQLAESWEEEAEEEWDSGPLEYFSDLSSLLEITE